jgi:hypothetical protein
MGASARRLLFMTAAVYAFDAVFAACKEGDDNLVYKSFLRTGAGLTATGVGDEEVAIQGLTGDLAIKAGELMQATFQEDEEDEEDEEGGEGEDGEGEEGKDGESEDGEGEEDEGPGELAQALASMDVFEEGLWDEEEEEEEGEGEEGADGGRKRKAAEVARPAKKAKPNEEEGAPLREGVYEVERLLLRKAVKWRGSVRYTYLVKWKDYNHDHNSWTAKSNLLQFTTAELHAVPDMGPSE